jgi:hypothetical protein
MRTRSLITAITVVAIILLALVGTVFAANAQDRPPSPPARFFGLNPGGTVIANDCAVSSLRGPYFVVDVYDACAPDGYVTFTVNGTPVLTAAIWANNKLNTIDLLPDCPKLETGWNPIDVTGPLSFDGLVAHCGATHTATWNGTNWEWNSRVLAPGLVWVYRQG